MRRARPCGEGEELLASSHSRSQWAEGATGADWWVREQGAQAQVARTTRERRLTLTEACGTTAQISLKVRALPVCRQAKNTMAASTAAWLFPLIDLALS